jgi:hypothetical protein
VLTSIILLVCEFFYQFFGSIIYPVLGDTKNIGQQNYIKMLFFHKNNGYDLMRGLFVILGCCSLYLFNMSIIYHYIRGQTMVKLYVLTAMMETLDKLLSSFGQDSMVCKYD